LRVRDYPPAGCELSRNLRSARACPDVKLASGGSDFSVDGFLRF
jgi:hypothetical protein